jgi:hypothetical protein
MTEADDADPVTRGGYVLPPPALAGQFAGPADDPDRYELIGAGISGGEGVTWRARYHGDLRAPLPLAVKQLHSPPTAADRRRWVDQAALLRHLRIDHVVHVHEVFFGPPPHEADKGPTQSALVAYLVMEWVDGLTLRELCGSRPASRQTAQERLRHVRQAATALTELASTSRSSGNPSLHRDIKPSNCIVHPERGLVLIDVSTLRLLDDGFDPVGWHTPQYTAPEVRASPHAPRTPAADVYSLGALAAFCLTGQDPLPDYGVLLRAARQADVADAAGLAAHIMTTLDDDPARRPTDLPEWSQRLVDLGRPAPPRWRKLGVAALVVLLLGGIALFRPWEPQSVDPVTPSPAAVLPAGYAGAITAPTNGTDVRQCSYFDGTATVPAGSTLILTMQNLTNGDPERYAEVVFGFDDPARLPRWRGAQYFGQGDQNVGQEYQVQLIAVPVAAVRAWRQTEEGGSGDHLAEAGVVLATVRLYRVAGSGPNNCEGP